MQEALTTTGESRSGQDKEQNRRSKAPLITEDVARWAFLLGGGLLALYGLRRPQRSLPFILGGGALVYRGATGHLPGSEQLALSSASLGEHSGVQITKVVTINKPREELYAFWRDLTNLPRVLTHLETVTPLSAKRSHWVAKAPLGASLTWDAEITEEQENTCIAWRSLPGAHVEHTGAVYFRTIPNQRGTELKVQIVYRPPGGAIGTALASFLKALTAQQIQEDLRAFKAIMEAGESPTITGQPSGRKTADDEPHSGASSAGVLGEVKEHWGFVAATSLAAFWLLKKRQTMDFAGKSVVITGGSRGLGLELARCFGREQAQLTLLARDAEELDQASQELERQGVSVLAYPCDVRNQQDVQQAVRYVQEQVGRIDILVNNAGIIQTGPLEHMSLRDFEDAMATHFWGPLYFMQAVIPHMQRQGGGRIVNIASIGGKVAIPHLTPYSASKFALTGLSEGMQVELAKDGIQVLTVSPGLMRTGSHVNASFKGQHEKEFAWFSTASALPFLSIQAKQAARQIVEACRAGDANVVISPQARFLDLAHTLFPDLTMSALNLLNYFLPGPTDERGDVLKSGKDSRSSARPSLLTSNIEQAAVRNNEV